MKTISLKPILIILTIITTFVLFSFIRLSLDRAAKRDKEIERIESHSYKYDNCEQYALVALKNGWFPCYNCGTKDSIYLYAGEVWKYGKTCLGENLRYSNGLPTANLRFIQQFKGTEKECLIIEKEKIYNYPNLPECQKRNFVLLRPAGNKIDR